MMRPTVLAVVLFAAGVPVSLLPVLIDEQYWIVGFIYFAFAALAIGVDWVFSLRRRQLSIAVDLPDILYVGDPEEAEVTVACRQNRFPTKIELLLELGPQIDPDPTATLSLAPDSATQLTLPIIATRRGKATAERILFRWWSPFRLLVYQQAEPLNLSIDVVPNIRAVRQSAIHLRAIAGFSGVKPQNLQGEGIEFDALRDYVPGLDLRTIDWKHSARHRKLVAKEFQAERNHQIFLAFDTGHLMSEKLGSIAKLDHAINAGLVLGHAALQGGDRVGVFGFDAEVRLYAEPVANVGGFRHVLRATAGLHYQHEETNFTLGMMDLFGRLNRRSLVIVFSDFADTISAELMVDNLHRLARRHVVVFVTLEDPDLEEILDRHPRSFRDVSRSVIAEELIRDRNVVMERLRRYGIRCLETRASTMSSALLNQYLAIKRQSTV